MTTSDYNSIRTGDIACFSSSHLFGRLIKRFTKGRCTHVGFLSVELDPSEPGVQRPYIYHAAKGWLFHQSFIKEPLDVDKEHPGCYKVVRLKYGQTFDGEKIVSNIVTAWDRANNLLSKKIPYDWLMIMAEGVRFVVPGGQRLTHMRPFAAAGDTRMMCSEAVSGHIWNPAWMEGLKRDALSLFADDPKQLPVWDTPRMIADSKNVVTIWER